MVLTDSMGIGGGSALGGDLSQMPFIGGLFPNPRQAEMQRQMQQMANDYARQRLINQQQREQALRQQLALFGPAQQQMGAMYGAQAAPSGLLTPESMFGRR